MPLISIWYMTYRLNVV